MSRYLSILLCTLFLSFASCEDKEKSSKNITTSPPAIEDTAGVEKEQQEKVEKKETTSLEKEDKIGPLIVQEEFIPFMTKYGEENPETRVRIKTRFGDIDVQLYRDTPLHRANFIYLIKRGYFDNTFFHRVAEGFVIQGGNSDNRDTSRKRNYIGSYLVPSEFEAGHRHTRGAFSAAKYSEQNVSKASSPYEFFIVQSHRGAHHLDNDHTVFGRVTSGMDVVDEIAAQEVGEGEWPLRNIYLEVEVLD
ncbi:peptidylprolyl isomerase [Antarcticibacterium flavum]|uniref:Peptidyl-prolyl cis-trans isomerase n=1 Tax=Antarcticibacterium flavum TaxID=2058175 RepID=A0A5B7X6T9_9FLAO|nr:MULTISPECIES: peptidylprolyl isomerase [Antarcticibacterium]MCM4160658.1 peptidylprolyl isomerase [Antarcticibacterium sp. W02-3]QCY71194.1 peptidylprolyl isomerase [Antarcticibacterium flavum]